MTFQHKTLAEGRWESMTLAEQMGNIGSEVSRASSAKKRGDNARAIQAFERGLELIDLTVRHCQKIRNFPAIKELLLARELMCDTFLDFNTYKNDLTSFQKYFDDFALAAALKNGK